MSGNKKASSSPAASRSSSPFRPDGARLYVLNYLLFEAAKSIFCHEFHKTQCVSIQTNRSRGREKKLGRLRKRRSLRDEAVTHPSSSTPHRRPLRHHQTHRITFSTTTLSHSSRSLWAIVFHESNFQLCRACASVWCYPRR